MKLFEDIDDPLWGFLWFLSRFSSNPIPLHGLEASFLSRHPRHHSP